MFQTQKLHPSEICQQHGKLSLHGAFPKPSKKGEGPIYSERRVSPKKRGGAPIRLPPSARLSQRNQLLWGHLTFPRQKGWKNSPCVCEFPRRNSPDLKGSESGWTQIQGLQTPLMFTFTLSKEWPPHRMQIGGVCQLACSGGPYAWRKQLSTRGQLTLNLSSGCNLKPS